MMPLQITPLRIEELWDAMAELPYCQADFAADKNMFTSLLMGQRNLFFELGLGFVSFLDVQPHAGALIKVTMFDKQLRGRESGVLELLREVVDAAELRRVTALVPQELRVLQKFYMRIGFKHEGRMRQSSPWGGDVHVYGILQKELEQWQDPSQEDMSSTLETTQATTSQVDSATPDHRIPRVLEPQVAAAVEAAWTGSRQ